MRTLIVKVMAVIVAAFIAVAAQANTVSRTMKEVAEDNQWEISSGSSAVCYNSFWLDDVVAVEAVGAPNCGSFWGDDWRLYQSGGGALVISVKEGYVIETVAVTYNYRNGGALRDEYDYELKSKERYRVDDEWVAFEVFSNTGKTSGQVKITAVEVVYHSLDDEGEQPQAEIGNSVDNAYGVAQVNDVVDKGRGADTAVYVKGVVSRIVEVSLQYGNATYYISDDGNEDSEQLLVFRGLFLDNQKFTALTDISVGDMVVVYGVVSKYSDVNEMERGNYICKIERSASLPDLFVDVDDNAPVYNINGTRISSESRGLVIKNGKKYIVR